MQSLFSYLKPLVDKGVIRQIDYQFARFAREQSSNNNIAFIAAIVSCELGRGHICLPLIDKFGQPSDLVVKLGVFGDFADQLHHVLRKIDWLMRVTEHFFCWND